MPGQFLCLIYLAVYLDPRLVHAESVVIFERAGSLAQNRHAGEIGIDLGDG